MNTENRLRKVTPAQATRLLQSLAQRSFALAALFLLLAFTGWAQVTTADIVGGVKDSSGAVVPNAKITIQNLDTRDTRTGESNASGEYNFTLLPVGRYSVKVESAGFKAFNVATVTVAPGDRARVDATMEIGQATETVEVEARGAALQTDSSTVGSLVTAQAVQELPLNGRNFINLAQLTAGTSNNLNNAAKNSGQNPDDRRPSQSISVGAQQSWTNNFMLDGLDNNDRIIGSVIVRPSVEALDSVRVLTTQYTAEVGRASGGVISLSTKSGTNNFHGTLFEFFRNDALDAKGWQSVSTRKPQYRLNQYGGSIGGPIIKDKTFFFGDYEAFNLRQGRVQTVSVPTALMRQGNFTEAGLPRIYDPATLDPVTKTRQQFSYNGVLNVIDPTRINPIAAKYMSLYPLPNGPGIVNNFASAFSREQDSGTFDIRVDHRISDRRYLYGRYSFNDITTFLPGSLGEVVPGILSGGTGGNPGKAYQRSQGVHLNYVEILSPNLILELKAGFARYSGSTLPLNYGNNLSNLFGIPNANVSELSSGLTTANPNGYESLGEANFVPIRNIDNVFQYQGAATWTKGTHTIKFGAQLIRRQFTPFQSTSPRGTFSFTANNTNCGNTLAGVCPTPTATGQSIASFLLGLPSAASLLETRAWQGLRSWEPGFFVHDDWRATSSLTINIGLRYDIFTPYTDVNNQISNFDPATAKIEVAGVNGVSDTANVKTFYKNFAPRFGFAKTFGRSLVLRGGYGISYMPGQTQAQSTLKNPPFISSTSQNIQNNVAIGQMYSISQGFPIRVPVDPNNPTGLISLSATEHDFKPSYTQNFSLFVQKEMRGNVLSVGYVGALSRHIMQSQQINNAYPAALSVNTQTTRPYAALLPGVAGIGIVRANGSLNYHSLQSTFERRLRGGLIANATYTWAHAISSGPPGNGDPRPGAQLPNDFRGERGNSSLDLRHRVTFSTNYQLPFGRTSHGLTHGLVSGWQLNGIWVWQTGLPFTVTNLNAATNVGADRPNVVGDPFAGDPTLLRWFNTAAFQTLTSQQVAAGIVAGNEGVNGLRGPRFSQVDASLFKNFAIRESLRLQFRAEMYNVLNKTNFGQPTAALGDPNFGRITTTAPGYVPRQLQFALKLIF